MVKKLQKSAEPAAPAPAGLLDSQLAQNIKDSAHQIWLAGLGAFAKAQGGGNKVFETLMKEGASLQRKTQAAAEEKLGDAAGKVAAMAGEVGHKANAQWDKLETIFEERTARALAKLGVPSAKSLADLGARLDALTTSVEHLQVPGDAAAKPRLRPVKDSVKKAARAAASAAAKPAGRKTAVKVAAAPVQTPVAPPAETAPAVAVKRRKAKAADAETAAVPTLAKAARKRVAAKP